MFLWFLIPHFYSIITPGVLLEGTPMVGVDTGVLLDNYLGISCRQCH